MFLKAVDLHFTYMPGTPFEVHALRGITFEMDRGEFMGIMGSTGSGKSTLVQHLNGLLRPSKGTVFIDGLPTGSGYSSLVALRKRIGMVFQFPEKQLFADTVFAEVAFGPRQMGLSREEIEERVREALSRAGLSFAELKDSSPFSLSGGQMRRVALAGVLAMRPEALILDEPTAMLDPAGRGEILDLIKMLQQNDGITVILVSHRPDELASYAERLLVLHGGKLIMQGSCSEVFSRGEELKQIGLGVPSMAELMQRLRQKGHPVKTGIFTPVEACEEILGLLGIGDHDR